MKVSVSLSAHHCFKTLEAGVPWDWATFGEYTKSLERSGLAVNASTYVGLPVVRHSVMGADAFEGVASEAQLDAMRTALHAALDEGALGISMNRLPIDRDDMGRTAAGLNCDWSELRAMAEVLREHPGTMVQCVPAFILPFEGFTDKDKVEQQEWIEVARAAGRPMVWSPLIEIWKDAHLEYLRDRQIPESLNRLRRLEVLLRTFSERSEENARRAHARFAGAPDACGRSRS